MAGFRLASLHAATIHVGTNADITTRFAAQELSAYLNRLTGTQLKVADAQALDRQPSLVVGAAAEPAPVSPGGDTDAFVVLPEATRVTCVANSARGVLHAVYSLLSQSGCRWSPHDPTQEFVPSLHGQEINLELIRGAPCFRTRGYATDIMTWHYGDPLQFKSRLDDDRAMIDWMGKTGANCFFFIRHPFDTQLTIPELLPEFRRRGIDVEYGGHVMPLLLPRELFATHPEYFPQSPRGERIDYSNMCTSNPTALAIASTNAVEWVRQHPETAAVHMWGVDVWKGGWCRCETCRNVRVQDQSLRLCNAVALALADVDAVRPVFFLAYHDTLDADITIDPHPGVWVEFAPRERCYGHALGDPTCETNRRYARAIERYTQWFAGRVRIFEYYGDAILFGGCAVPLTEVIARDLAYYRQLGIREITMLQFGTFSAWAYALNFLAFAEGTTIGGTQVDSIDTYCRRFGPLGSVARAGMADLECALRPVVTYGDIMRAPRDPVRARRVLESIEGALPQIAATAQALGHHNDEALGAHLALMKYTQTILRGVADATRRMLADVDGGGSPDQRSGANQCYDEALRIMEQIDHRFKGLWGTVDLPILHQLHTSGTFSMNLE